MEDQLALILQNFHEATNLNLYVLNEKNKLAKKFVTPLAPDLSKDLVNKINQKNDLNFLLINNQSSIAQFAYQNYSIICWNSNFTISNGNNYDHLAPLLGWDRFIQNMNCLFFMIFKHWPEVNVEKKKFNIGENIYSPHQKKASYEGYLVECELMDIVSKGNINLYNQYFREFVEHANIGEFGQNKLRNAKDMAIAATTLYTRAAIRGGLPASEAYNLSDDIISHIEKDNVISNYYEYSRSIGEIFVNRVYRTKRLNITSTVYKAQEYIYSNFAKITSVKKIADNVGVSVSYLQHRFKNETGSSLIDFINQEKINFAKHELIFSENSIEEIANNSGFKNLSVFSSTFKKLEKRSPSNYRKEFK